LLAKLAADQVIGIALASGSTQRAVAAPIRNTALANILQHGRDLGANCSPAVDSILDELVADDPLNPIFTKQHIRPGCPVKGRADFLECHQRLFYHSGDKSWVAPAIRLQPSLMQKVIDINIEHKQLGASMARAIRILQEGKVGCAFLCRKFSCVVNRVPSISGDSCLKTVRVPWLFQKEIYNKKTRQGGVGTKT
jgi:hypothetical protein